MRLSILSAVLVLGVALLWGSGATACDKVQTIIVEQQSAYYAPAIVQEVRVQRVVQRQIVQRQIVQQKIVQQKIVQQKIVQQKIIR